MGSQNDRLLQERVPEAFQRIVRGVAVLVARDVGKETGIVRRLALFAHKLDEANLDQLWMERNLSPARLRLGRLRELNGCLIVVVGRVDVDVARTFVRSAQIGGV